MNTSKSTEASTGTSYVFAEPLLSAPKRERSYSVEELDCKEQLDEGFESAAGREERRESAPATLPADEPVPPPAVPGLTIFVTEAAPVIAVSSSPSPSPITPSFVSAPTPTPTPTPTHTEPPTETAEPRKPSWFVSLSRTKRRAAQLHRRAVTTSATAVAVASASTSSFVEPPPTLTVTILWWDDVVIFTFLLLLLYFPNQLNNLLPLAQTSNSNLEHKPDADPKTRPTVFRIS
ncbi:hypothetical protein DXG01_008121 [Tephrocybe rancida]|nr:hypothetical protein DXG01_008121 [Tephrocybe rancida]